MIMQPEVGDLDIAQMLCVMFRNFFKCFYCCVAEISSQVESRTCVMSLSSKIVSLGRVYTASENYFPLGI